MQLKKLPLFTGIGCLLVLHAVGATAIAQGAPEPELRLTAGTFRPSSPRWPAPSWYQAIPLDRSAGGRRYLVAITRSGLGAGERAQLQAAGAELLDYLPVHGYRLRCDPLAEPSIRAFPFVVWLGDPGAHFKVEPRLASRVVEAERETELRAILAPDEPVTRARDVLEEFQATATPAGKDGAWRITAAVPGVRLAEILSKLAALPEVEAVEEVRPLRPLNQDAVWVHQSFVGPSPQQTPVFDRGIYGCGQVVAFADTGQDYDACFFRDTVNGPPPFASCPSVPCAPAAPAPTRRKDILYYNWSGSTPNGDDAACSALTGGGHGTHTSGSIAADTSPYANCSTFSSPGRNGGDGQAPGAKLVVQEMGDSLEYLTVRGGTVWNLADVAYQSGARIHSNSWGGSCQDALGECAASCTLPYDSFARDADLAMWEHPELLLVYAVGNAAVCAPPNAVTTPAIAKSVVSVGAVGHAASANNPSSTSSPGPVFDGRLKPTLAAQGESTVSAASDGSPSSNNCSTCSLTGTSMSAPTVAGIAALAREYYTEGFYATGTRTPAQGFTPSGALIKASLIDGAVALGPSAPEADFTTGYGRVLLGSTLAFSGSPFQLRVDDHREGLATGSIVTHAYDVATGTALRATLVWTDYPAALNAAVARVNELKLEVIDPGGNVWFQTVDSVSGAPVQTMNAADPHDPINVEERFVFDLPQAGRWVFRVIGVDVPWDPQPFALVVRGALSDCPAPAAPAAPSLTTPADHQVEISWNTVPGAAAYSIFRKLGACPSGPWVPLVTGTSGTSYLDTTVSGGATYSYYVVATSDLEAHCESARSPCASVVPTGDCTLAPDFNGIESALSAGAGTCTVQLSWSEAAPPCGSAPRYNVYRDTSAGFLPAPANRIARCVAGETYTDSVDLGYGTTYYYIVRAEDATTGHGGPCRDGNEDSNLMRVSTAPDGPPAFGTYADDAGDTGAAEFTSTSGWTNPASGGNLGPKVYQVGSSAGACADLTGPTLSLADPGQGPQLSFATKHNLEFDPFGPFGAEGSVGQVEIAVGPAFDNWNRVLLTPDYPEFVDFTLINCTSTGDAMTFFTSNYPTYTTYGASLVNWAGGDVKIRFHLSGDFFYPGGNWWIDDVSVTQTLVPGSCTTIAAGPPPIPDGAAVLGQPLRASRSGGNVLVTWDAARCPATAVNLYYGAIGAFSAFTGGACDLPPTGSATLPLPDDVWFLVAATDGGSTDGSWGRTLDGAERTYAGASTACPAITLHLTNNGCP